MACYQLGRCPLFEYPRTASGRPTEVACRMSQCVLVRSWIAAKMSMEYLGQSNLSAFRPFGMSNSLAYAADIEITWDSSFFFKPLLGRLWNLIRERILFLQKDFKMNFVNEYNFNIFFHDSWWLYKILFNAELFGERVKNILSSAFVSARMGVRRCI